MWFTYNWFSEPTGKESDKYMSDFIPFNIILNFLYYLVHDFILFFKIISKEI